MEKQALAKTEIVHQFAGFLYWVSMLLLLAGMWALISPFHRQVGLTGHIYITLGAFEVYIWLLLILGRWQLKMDLVKDAGRSGIFALVLSGFMFHVLNELYMAAAGQGYVAAVCAAGLTVMRMAAAKRWLGLHLPRRLMAAWVGWVVLMTLPPMILRLASAQKDHQYLAAYIICWAMAFYVAGHILLVAWQKRQGWLSGAGQFGQWWIGWMVSAILGGLAAAQLYAVMRSMFVDGGQWYFIPIYLAAGVVTLCLCDARGRHYAGGIMVSVLAIIHALVFIMGHDTLLMQTPQLLAGGFAARPLYMNALFAALLLGWAWIVLRQTWQLLLAVIGPAGYTGFQITLAVMKWRYGKGVALLLGAFAALGAAALLQWWYERSSAHDDEAEAIVVDPKNLKAGSCDWPSISKPPFDEKL